MGSRRISRSHRPSLITFKIKFATSHHANSPDPSLLQCVAVGIKLGIRTRLVFDYLQTVGCLPTRLAVFFVEACAGRIKSANQPTGRKGMDGNGTLADNHGMVNNRILSMMNFVKDDFHSDGDRCSLPVDRTTPHSTKSLGIVVVTRHLLSGPGLRPTLQRRRPDAE